MGDHPSSLPALFERYGGVVHRRCRQLLGESRADDAVQEVFLRVLRSQAGFRGESSELTWLYRIATTYCLQQLRNHKRWSAKLAERAGELPLPGLDPIQRIEALELLEGFDLETQTIVVLRHVDGMTLEEVAEIAGVSRKTVAKRLSEWRTQSRRKLGEAIEDLDERTHS